MEHRGVDARKHDREKGRRSGRRAVDVAAREARADERERELHDEKHDEVDGRGERANPEAGRTSLNHAAYNIAMISVQDGQNQILRQLAEPTPPEVVAVTRARERVLAEDLLAPFDVPPCDNSAVDGYAVASDDVPASRTRELDVLAEIAAGGVFDGAVASGTAVRITTGGPVTRGGG